MAQKKSKSASKPGGVQGYSIIAIAITLLGLLICGALLYWQLISNGNQKHAAELAERETQSLVTLVNSRIGELREQVQQLASSTDVVDALINNDPARLAIVADRIAALVPSARRVDLIASGEAKVDLTAETPLSFAALDLIRRAETTEIVGPEASVNQNEIVFAAAPVTDRSGVIGVFFIALDKNYLTRVIRPHANGNLIQIEQNFESNVPTIVISVGDANQSAAADPVRAPLTEKSWNLLFAPKQAPALLGQAGLITPLLVALALALGGIMLAFSRLAETLSHDSKMLTDYCSKLLRGRTPSFDQYRLDSMQDVASKLAEAKTTAAQPAEAGLDFDAVTKTKEKTTAAVAGAGAAAAALAGAAAATPDESTAESVDEEESLFDDESFLDDDSFLDIDEDEEAETVAEAVAETTAEAATEQAAEQQQSQGTDNFGIGVSEGASPIDLGLQIEPSIFRAYDIRGRVDQELTSDVVYWIGRAFAAEARSKQQTASIVGCDGRLSSPTIKEALSRGLTEGGLNVIDIGEVATPMLYFATHTLGTSTGIMITGSHNPPEYNGLKMMIRGETLAEDSIESLYTRIVENQLEEATEEVEITKVAIDNDYTDRILDDIAISRGLKIVVDCGNGVAGNTAPRLLQELGCHVIPLYCDVDGTFPNHHPDPADPANMQDLIAAVKTEEADLGLAFDGDGDRLGVVTNEGNIVWPDKLLMLFAKDIVSRNPGTDVVYDVKCSRHLNTLISEHGGRPVMWRTGHSHLKAKIKETGALLGGEFSGHIAFAERWYGFDDAIYSAARLLEIIGSQSSSSEELFAEFPSTEFTPEIKIETTDDKKFEIIDQLVSEGDFGDGTTTNIDGVRVDYEDGWGLVRASNTSPVLTLRFEADNSQAMTRLQQLFRQQLAKIDSNLTF